MMTKKQLGWGKLFLLLTVLPCCRSLEVSISQEEYEVAKGGDITMTCSFVPANPDLKAFLLKWNAYPDNINDPLQTVATYFTSNLVNIAPAYEGRASLEVDVNQRVSLLRLTKVTMQDTRRYECSVIIPNDDEGRTAAITSLLVLEPPSPPICRIKGKAEYFHNISLTCVSEEGSPAPTYEWKSYSVQNTPKQFPPRTTEKDGVLSLFNISRDVSGFYVCISTNRIGSAHCNFTLAVMPGSFGEASMPILIGVGVVAGILVIGVIIFCCCRKKGKKDKYAEGGPDEVQYYDRDTPEAGEKYWDEKSTGEIKQVKQYEDKDEPPSIYNGGPVGRKFEDDERSQSSGKGRSEVGSTRFQEDPRDHYRGSRDRLEDQRDYRGSRDRLDDQRDRYGGSRDRLDDQRDYRGSRDRLDDQRDRYRGSRDRLDDQRDYRGSRDRLDDQRDYRGSRDRLDDQRDYRGSRDRLDDQRDYRGSRDRLDDQRDRDYYRNSRDHLDYAHNQYGNQYD